MASNTDKLQLNLINGSDVIDPDVLNQNMQILDALGVSYIVDQGTSGEWWYRKWSDGRAECGIDAKNFGKLTMKNPWGSMYSYGTFNFGAYPFTFAEQPMYIIMPNKTKTGATAAFCAIGTTGSTSQAPSFHYIDPYSGTTIEDAHFSIYVIGRWK